LDADERVTPQLASEISGHVGSSPASAASFTRLNLAFGRRMRFGPLWPDRVVRLFPKGSVRWEGLVHERPLTELPVTRLKGSVFHHTYPDYKSYVEKQASYARLWAENARRRGKSATPFKAFARAFFAFLKMFALKLGFLDGPAGWCLCWYYSGAYTLGKYLLLADGRGDGGRDGPGPGQAVAGPESRRDCRDGKVGQDGLDAPGGKLDRDAEETPSKG
jgi:hypothetical protein